MDMKIYVHLKKYFWFQQKDIENITYKYWNIFYLFRKQLIVFLIGKDLLYYNIQLDNKENKIKNQYRK